MTKIDKYLSEIKERVDNATSGPWEFKSTKDTGGIRYVFAPSAGKNRDGCEFIVADVNRSFNAELIAHARTDIEVLLKLISYLKTLVMERTDTCEIKYLMADIESILEKKGEL